VTLTRAPAAPRVERLRPDFDGRVAPALPEQPPLVLLANRLPIVKTGKSWRPSPGGLVAALRPAFESRRGSWVGWAGQTAGVPGTLPGLGANLVPVALSRKDVESYYHGFSNSTLWPLFHGLADRVTINGRWWRNYCDVNLRFARRAIEVAPPDAFFWVHDYHLARAPLLLRELGVTQPIGFFLHIPFPAQDLFARLPWRDQLLAGLLGADVVSFQTDEYRDNFFRAALRLRQDAAADGTVLCLGDGRSVVTATHPISIDARGLHEQAQADDVERALERLRAQFAGRRVLVGVDRLDYTKGIVERLRAIELLLERRRDLRGKIAFVQIAVPSRGDIREYRDLRSHVEELVGRINGRFTTPGQDVPVHYLYRGVPQARLLAYYRLADVCIVTSLRDGMNLVAKEFVVCQDAGRGRGVLVLSEFAGASEELREALPCNPFDVEDLATIIARAIDLDEDERRCRIHRLGQRVVRRCVFDWLGEEMDALERVRARAATAV
jgi:trehalose 6-phosphate synthase